MTTKQGSQQSTRIQCSQEHLFQGQHGGSPLSMKELEYQPSTKRLPIAHPHCLPGPYRDIDAASPMTYAFVMQSPPPVCPLHRPPTIPIVICSAATNGQQQQQSPSQARGL